MELLSHAATVLPVLDPVKSIEFYEKSLGFEVVFKWNDPVDYVVLRRGDVHLHLTRTQDSFGKKNEHVACYIFVYDIRAIHQEFKSKGLPVDPELSDREYGMTDFDIEDPDGHILSFGQGK